MGVKKTSILRVEVFFYGMILPAVKYNHLRSVIVARRTLTPERNLLGREAYGLVTRLVCLAKR